MNKKLWIGTAVVTALAGIYVLVNFNWIAPYFMLPVRGLQHHAEGTLKSQQNPNAASAEQAKNQGIWWGHKEQDPAIATGEQPPKNAIASDQMPSGTMSVEAGVDGAVQRLPIKGDASTDWPHFNRTLTAQRFSGLAQINKTNVAQLKAHCTYETGKYGSFTTGIINVEGTLYFSTTFETFAIDADTCKEKWRVSEKYNPATPQGAQRGVAYGDGRIYRGLTDARVLAYDAKTGKKLWEQTIGDPKHTESVVAAPIAWNGMVFIGTAGDDFKGNKGRMYGIDGATGKILWEFFMVPKAPEDKSYGPTVANALTGDTWGNKHDVPISGGGTWTTYTLDPDIGTLYIPGGNPAPDLVRELRPGSNLYTNSVVMLDAKTGAYKKHISVTPKDFHDWDVSGPPALVRTKSGRDLMLLAPKDGHLYGFDQKSFEPLYRTPVTKIENADVPFEVGKPVYFCPGISGGAEWNGPSYNPENNLVYIGEMEWCTTVSRQSDDTVKNWPAALPWFGNTFINPSNLMGKLDSANWGGWVYALDADSGKWKWRVKTNYPIWAATLPTAGGLVFFGDVGGNFYALDADTGAKLFHKKLDGAMGGGIITYAANGKQRIAIAGGLTQIVLPTEIAKNRIIIMGLE